MAAYYCMPTVMGATTAAAAAATTTSIARGREGVLYSSTRPAAAHRPERLIYLGGLGLTECW